MANVDSLERRPGLFYEQNDFTRIIPKVKASTEEK